MNEQILNPGGLPYIADERDFQWSNIGSSVAPYDWSKSYDVESSLGLKLPIKDQNGSGSCGGQAYSSYDSVIEAVATKTFEERSAKYIIAQTYVLDSNGNMLGSSLTDNASLVKSQGVSKESLCLSYDHARPPGDAFMNRREDITESARADAKTSKAKSYAFVLPNIDTFAQAIEANHGLIMVLGGENNGTWNSAFPKPPKKREWGHFMYCGKVKMIDGKKYIGALQSWGPNVGDAGWQWFGEDYFNSGFIEIGQTFIFDDTAPLPPKYIFTRDLTVGSSGVDVKYLQVFLNNHGYPVALNGEGSLGNETSYFGELTKNAVAKFQSQHGISPSVGYFGPLTRKVVNNI